MRLSDYLAGQPLVLMSPFPPEECKRRINEAAGFPLNPFRKGVIGGVWFSGHLRLRFRRSIREYQGKPVVAGRIERSGGGSRLELRYRAPVTVYISVAAIIPAIVLILWIVSSGPGASPSATSIGFVALVVVAGLLAQMIGHRIGTRHADVELAEIVTFLQRTIKATRLPA